MEVIAPYLEDHQKMAWSTADISAAVSANLGFAVQTDSAWTLFVNTAQQVVNFFTPYAKALTFPEESFAPFDGPVQNLADSIGMGSKASMIKFVLILLAVYPITGLFAILPFKFLKHTVSLATGVFLAQWMFGAEWFNSLFSSAVAYAILAIASLVPAVGRYQHVLVFAWMMGYMTAAHFWRLHTDYLGWSMDYTGPQMILTIKLTSLAFNLWDGRQKAKYDEAIKKASAMDKPGPGADKKAVAEFSKKSAEARLKKRFLEKAITSLPNPLHYFGYVYLPSSFFAGPAFEYSIYINSINGNVYGVDPVTKTKDLAWGSRIQAALLKLLGGLAFLGLTVVAMSFGISADTMYSPQVLAGTSIWYRIGWDWLVLFFCRCKYYFAWLVAEGATNLAGFGYTPAETKEGKVVKAAGWGAVGNIDVVGFELASDVSAASKAWNMGTQNWLSTYCYMRVPRSIQFQATYFLSAFWHGFYPGYYLTFMSVPLFQNLERAIKEKISPRIQGTALWTPYSFLSIVITSLSLNYLVCPFQALSWDDSLKVWASLYFAGHLLVIVFIFLLSLVPKYKGAAAVDLKAKKTA